MEDLNYRPDGVARSLAAKRTMSIGIIAARITTSLFPEILAGVTEILGPAGYSSVLADSRESEDQEADNLRVLSERRVDGILWIPSSAANLGMAKQVAASGTPIGIMDRRLNDSGFDTVVSDNVGAGRLATQHMVQTGHRRIGIVTFSSKHAPSRERVEGYLDGIRLSGIAPDDDSICSVDFPEYDAAVNKLEVMIRDCAPDGIIACSDSLTLATLQVLKRLNLSVGRDVSVIGFDRSDWSAHLTPPLTMIIQDTEAIGRVAARLLLNRIRSKAEGAPMSDEPQLYELPTSLIRRASCGEDAHQ
jgi:DNA-binding LacI/PurR family transcriptional regulator